MKSSFFQTVLLGLLVLWVAFGTHSSLFARTMPVGLATGDLLFLDLRSSTDALAISIVTKQQNGVQFSLNHVGIIDVQSEHQIFVIESTPPKGVVRTPLEKVLGRVSGGLNENGGYRIGHWREDLRSSAWLAVERAKLLVGEEYDPTFRTLHYCSGLVGRVLLDMRDSANVPLFHPHPMYFGKPGSGIRKFWERYFTQLHTTPPDGEAGYSPLSIYLEATHQHYFAPRDLK